MLRRAVCVLALCLGATVAVAQPDPSGFEPPPSQMRRPEVLTQRPSGFWTSNRPANGSRYRWRIMGAGALVLAVTGVGVFFLLRAVGSERARSGS